MYVQCTSCVQRFIFSEFLRLWYINWWNLLRYYTKITAWKVSKYGVFSGPYFPVLGLNTQIYKVNLRIESECRKILTRKNSILEHFSHSESDFHYYFTHSKPLYNYRYLTSLFQNFDGRIISCYGFQISPASKKSQQ